MNNSTMYTIGRLHGFRKQPASRIFMSDTSWEAQQYRQGYIDGGVALEDDMAFEKALIKKETKHDQRD
jgi:hypothetical protein